MVVALQGFINLPHLSHQFKPFQHILRFYKYLCNLIPTMPRKTVSEIDQYWHKTGICGLFTRAALRTLQFVLAVTVAALYGVDLAHATKTNIHARPEWVYAEFVAAVSVITCAVHCFVTVVHVTWSTWDGVLFVLWMAQVGVFGTIYVSDQPANYEEFATSVTRMRVAVWINLINMLLWLVTFVLGIAWCIRTRKVTRRTDQLDFDKDILEVGVEIDKKKGLADGEKHGHHTSKRDQEASEAGSMMKMIKS